MGNQPNRTAKRLLPLVLLLSLLSVACDPYIVRGKAIRDATKGTREEAIQAQNSGAPLVCLSVNMMSHKEPWSVCRTKDFKPLTMQCYNEAKIGDYIPDSCNADPGGALSGSN